MCCSSFVCQHCENGICTCENGFPVQRCKKNIRDLCKEAFHCANCKLAANCSLIAFQKKQEEIDKNKKIAADAKSEEMPAVKKSAYAYVDGSYNQNTSTYGYGGYLVDEQGNGHLLQGSGCDPEMASMRNVSGEILGAEAAMKKAEELGIKELTLYFDYIGIEAWVTGKWRANKEGTQRYRDVMRESSVKIVFKKVKGHSGVQGNEEADLLAKEAVGL